MMNLEKICKEVVDLSQEVGNYLREENARLDHNKIEIKGKNDFVTYVDKESERRLVKGLTKIFPEAGFLTEEGTVRQESEKMYRWIIDPLDGTTNYVHQLCPYSISIALMCEEKVLLGCVYEVTLDEAFYAWENGGAWLNARPIHVSHQPQIEGGIIAYGIPYLLEEKYDYLRRRIPEFYGKATLRHLGSAAAEICYVAAGRVDAYFHDNLSPWDVAAGAIIVQEAGGRITDLQNQNNYVFGRELAATNNLIHNELLNTLITEKERGK